MKLLEPYRERPIRPLRIWQEGRWRLKVYGIAYNRSEPREELLSAARRVVRIHLSAVSEGRDYGVGFTGIHDGRGANFVFLSWWADENELHHHVWVSPSDQPDRLEYKTPSGLVGCTWDLRVITFERDAWLNCILRNRENPSLDRYLAATFSEDAWITLGRQQQLPAPNVF